MIDGHFYCPKGANHLEWLNQGKEEPRQEAKKYCVIKDDKKRCSTQSHSDELTYIIKWKMHKIKKFVITSNSCCPQEAKVQMITKFLLKIA